MRSSSKRPVKLNPYWQPQADALYGETAFALAWLEPVWFEDARSVPDGWSPDLASRADEWAAWQEEVELRAVMETELAEYQQQMEAAYARRLYEEQAALYVPANQRWRFE